MSRINLTRESIVLTSTIHTFMSAHHKECDELFSQAEEAVSNKDWSQATPLWSAFATELEKHFSREEGVLFPEFESQTGMTGGPTQMMRMEHEQMRSLVNEINKATEAQDQDQFLALSETLMVTMQQHNMKEEQVLYPMTDQSLSNVAQVIDQMGQV